MTSQEDIYHMRHALSLAWRGLGCVAPNPAVGCVIVDKAGHIIGRGWTGKGGRPHAETVALKQAGPQAKGSTVYVTFEPCCHHGQTPPCTEALIKAGVARVVVACRDPDPRVSGQGIKALQDAGIKVATGILEEEALALNRGFILRMTQGRPLVTLKVATGADGRFFKGDGQPRWVTGEAARRRAHLERSFHDAILLGIGAALADDPLLTTRLEGVEHNIIRVILDARLELPADSQLVKTASSYPLWVFCVDGPDDKFAALERAGCRLFRLPDKSLSPVLSTLVQEGITRLMVEGGAHVNGIFLSENVVDRLLWFKSPEVIGAEGMEAVKDGDLSRLEEEYDLQKKKTLRLDEDLLEIYIKSA